MVIKKQLKKLVPSLLWGWLHSVRSAIIMQKRILEYKDHYGVIIKKLQKKNKPINVLFFVVEASSWKYDSLYNMMLEDPLFNPLILICPQVNRGHDYMLERLNKCAEYFNTKNYKYLITYDDVSNSYLDAHTLEPDIICYTNPYQGLIDDRYYLYEFEDTLSCYINYAYNNVQHAYHNNLPFHHRIWKYFVECDMNKQLLQSYSPINGINCVVTGYPMYDIFMQGTTTGKDWKIKDVVKKRIIWSPHHTISNQSQLIRFSTFELYYDLMWNMAQKYRDQVQIVFKPHPLLKEALYRLEGWGKERTDAYYDMWSNGKNTAFVDGDYIDLFNTSDAMINDSGSFTIEYLYMRKPCLYLNNYNRQTDANEVALKAFDCWYKATTKEQIEDFIKEVVLEGNDPLRIKREAFYNEVLLPPNGSTAAENMVNEIKKELRLK